MTDEANKPSLEAELEKELAEALGDHSVMDLMEQAEPIKAKPTRQAGSPADPPTAGMRPGLVTAIHDDNVFVHLGGKDEGICAITEFDEVPKIGQTLEFFIEGLIEDEGLLKLNRKNAVEARTLESLELGINVHAHVTGSNTGGLELKVAGRKAFMPLSQIDVRRVEDLRPYLNQKILVKVIQLDKKGKNIVLSRRAVIEEEAARDREKVLATIEVDQIREGTVSSLQKFGAFVDLGGVDGLIHISDLTHGHVQQPSDVVEVGQTVKVKVLKVDLENQRISLGLKQVQPDPWDGFEEKYPFGETITGRVTKTAPFGAFVEMEPGVEGLIPMGELSWEHVARASDVVQEGQTIKVKVVGFEPKRRRVTLSIKQLSEDPWATADRTYMEGAVVKGKVTRTTDFGAFVELEPGIEGLIHISQLSAQRTERVEHVVKEGDEVEVKVVSFDPDKQRIGLSIRALTDPGDGDGGGDRRASKDDTRNYIKKQSEARATESLGALLNKFGGDGGGLKGGIG